ncbi:hypothetical protein [Streptococcus suis]|uniref:hypothetical protein n=1 Tax=Streptococcus suis TaxID=1307 RepID=UPI0039F1C4E9
MTKNSLRGFRAVLFRMVSKRDVFETSGLSGFRAVLFRMVSKRDYLYGFKAGSFRAVLFRMVSKRHDSDCQFVTVLELCCFEWFQNVKRQIDRVVSFRVVLL